MMSVQRKSTTGIALMFGIIACGVSSEIPENPAARVGDAYLSDESVRFENSADRAEYIEGWVEQEVLSGKSLTSFRQSTYRTDKIIASFASRLRAQVFLDSLIRQKVELTEDSLLAYYQEHAQEFQPTRPAAFVKHVGFYTRQRAVDAKRLLENVTTGADSLWLTFNTDEKVVYESDLHPSLGGPIFSARENSLLGPIESEFGYHVIYVRAKYKTGDQFPFAIVREKIYHQLLRRKWPTAELAILDSLREESDIEIYTK